MRLQVKLFAAARTLAGTAVAGVDVGEHPTIAEVRAALAAAHAELAPLLGSVVFAVNAEYADDHTPLAPDDEIACIPPVSGG